MRYIQFIILFLPLFCNAQTTFQLSVDSRSGYEYNAFNQPQPLSTDTTDLKVIQSGTFQQLGFASTLKKTEKAHQFSWTSKGRIDHFWQLSAANLQRWETGFGYQYQWEKKTNLRINLNYLSYQTNRLDNGTAVINIPSAYRSWNSRLGYNWQPFKYNKSALSLQATKRNFAATQNDQLQFWRWEGKFSTSQRFKRKGKKSSYLSLSLNFQQRNYTNTVFEEELDFDELALDDFELEEWENEEDDPNTYRRWQYFTSTMDYAFYANKALKITVGMTYERRRDVWDEQFGYQQVGQFLQLRWKKESWQLDWKIATTFRQFSDLFADENEDFYLQHLYLRNRFSLNYQLTPSWNIFTNVNLRKRWRNQPENSTNRYLPYLTGMMTIGIKYKLKKSI